jgi:hypothetical protein
MGIMVSIFLIHTISKERCNLNSIIFLMLFIYYKAVFTMYIIQDWFHPVTRRPVESVNPTELWCSIY